MPRNPRKKRCTTPGCRNWAMRGYDLCRSHRDPIFGPRSGGAPTGNLNAVKSGLYAQKLPDAIVTTLAHHLVTEPDKYYDHLAWAIKKLHYPKDLCASIQLLIVTLTKLQPQLANTLFTQELDAYAEKWPPHKRAMLRAETWKYLNNVDPVERLYILRDSVERLPDASATSKRADPI